MENKENIDVAPDETSVANAANLDALAAPEGGYDAETDGESFMKSEDQLLDNSNDENLAPNIDQEIKPPNEPEQTAGASNVDSETPQAEITNTEDQSSSETAQIDDYWMEPFNKLKEQYEDFELPEDVNKDNYLDYLKDVHTYEAYNRIHPDLLKMQEALDAGIDFNTLVKNVNESTGRIELSDSELLRQEYKNSNKSWDDEKVSAVIEKLDNAGMLEIEAGRVRNRLEKDYQSNLDNLKQQEFKRNSEQESAYIKERETQIKDALKSLDSMDDVYGLPISKAEKVEFAEYFKSVVTPDEQGVAPLMQMLQSNDNLVKIAAMIWKGSDKIKSAINDAKENGKNSIKDKLHSSPNTGFKSGGSGGELNIDLDALASPERLI